MDEKDYERAAEFAEREREHSLQKHRQRMAAQGEGRSDCIECGGEIPPERRKAVNAVLCVDCQSMNEHRERTRA